MEELKKVVAEQAQKIKGLEKNLTQLFENEIKEARSELDESKANMARLECEINQITEKYNCICTFKSALKNEKGIIAEKDALKNGIERLQKRMKTSKSERNELESQLRDSIVS